MEMPRTLPDEVTIYTVGELKPLCQGWLTQTADEPGSQDATWALDAHAVGQADAAGVQLMLALDKSLAGMQRRLQLLNPSNVLSEACASLGLADWLAERTVKGDPA
ncbi:STAS domain-containing protein [Hydrogenophaga sp. 5NK40-0174]|uniref:STAS domain-containing protein n=1 Tax=Hydrogenophaga sp. 5NK40-0174 TaxID=3127649 RepID=UPI0031096F00